MSKLVIAGGTGFLGNKLIDFYTSKYNEIVVLTRGKSRKKENISYVNWDAKTINKWHTSLNNADVLINLTGKSVDCRFTKENKALILNSRTESTTALAMP
ncbi:NAD-dependent epimerase/dehydratase family protein [Cellulophaga sp. RHA19]|uniref:NAD-dependent epimerase/dehydratase family protein n=1 Tax=Cellulophaga sp. RHA19 TaxID=1798237 RepID=UPI00269F159C|nr:NAD-dependent epimerase/dehydratase family protein [Cellulophaga sp. RHA19]